jgi:two-component system, NarL family, nitrate/nitrite response regulator NarL
MAELNQKEFVKVVVGDDHPLFRDALAQLAFSLFPKAQVGVASTMSEVMEQSESGSVPDLLLLDLLFPGMEFAVTLPELRRRYPKSSIILISMISDRTVISQVLQSGGDGFIHKATPREQCIEAIQRVLAGEYVVECDDLAITLKENLGENAITLTARQRAVLGLLAENAPNKLIARDLGISHLTVRLYVSALLRIFGVAKRQEVAPKARMLGLLDTD